MLVLLLLLSSAVAMAQVASSSLAGEVRDPSAAVVPGATVTAVHQATGFSQAAVTSGEGVYRLEQLLPGRHTITVEKEGFQTTTTNEITLAVNQRGRLNFDLRAGSPRDSITVEASVSMVQADDSSVGYRLGADSIGRLPLVDRNVISLATLGPGAIPRQLGGFVHDVVNDLQPARGAVALNPPIHGSRSTMNFFLLDGVSNTDRHVFAMAVHPPLESVHEFRIQTSLASAEFPQAAGGVVDVVTKSGGRDFHGSVFEFFRDEAADARSYFDDPSQAQPIFRKNQFGGSLSGPLPLPRTVFFATYEGLRSDAAKSSLNIVPDNALRGGNFQGRAPIFDPLRPEGNGSRLPFVNNVIPENRIDPAARRFLDEFQPEPNTAGPSGNYLDAGPSRTTNDTFSARIDHQLSNYNRLFGRYTLNEDRKVSAGNFPLLPTSQELRAQQATIGFTVSRARWLNETRGSFTRLRVFAVPESAFERNIAEELGVGGLSSDPFTWGLPQFLVTNFNLRTDDPILPQVQRNHQWNINSGFTVEQGRHTLKTGGHWGHFQNNYRESRLSRGQFIFTGAFTADPASAEATGDPFADFLIGLPQETRRHVGPTQAYLHQHTYGVYVQDDWRINANVTLNLGLRYDYFSPFTEQRHNLLNVDYSSLPESPGLRRVDRAAYADRNNFGPRIGMAWRLPRLGGVLGGLVFRAGYGVYFTPEIAIETYDLIRNGIRNETNQSDGSARPVLTLANGFPETATTGFPSYFALDRRSKTPYVQQWTAGVQRELGQDTVLEIVYVGAKGTKLGRYRTFNTPLHAVTGGNLPPRPGDLQFLRPFPELGPIIRRQHIANSAYNALEVKVERRFASRFSLLGSFAWAKSIDDADSVVPGQFESFGAQDERNLRLERGLSFFDVRKRVSAGFVYQTPKVRPLAAILSDWQFSGIVTLQDGTPLNPVYFALDLANTGTPNRPDIVPGEKISLPRSERTIERFFNTDAFRTPQPFTFGNAGRNIIPGPGNALLDLAVSREFPLGERVRMSVRVESFNAFNHPNWGIPGPYPDFGPFFGRIFSTGEPRRFQLGARLEF